MDEEGPARVLRVSAPNRTSVDRYREDRPGPPRTTEPSSDQGRGPILRRMEITRGRRHALSTALAFVLAVESVSAVAAAAHVSTVRAGQHVDRGTAPAASVGAATATSHRVFELAPRTGRTRPVAASSPAAAPSTNPTARRTEARSTGLGKLAAPAIRHRGARPAGNAGQRGNGVARPSSFSGRNRLWIPSLGLNRSISWFSCSRASEPDNHVYRWGCAGSNNVYLLGHAWGVFKPLHDAYTNGRLKVGMKAMYADAGGRVHVYAVRWWKVVRPTTSASWAWASLSSPSMTLQTCVGANSKYRLMVRLGEVGR